MASKNKKRRCKWGLAIISLCYHVHGDEKRIKLRRGLYVGVKVQGPLYDLRVVPTLEEAVKIITEAHPNITFNDIDFPSGDDVIACGTDGYFSRPLMIRSVFFLRSLPQRTEKKLQKMLQ
jgi:hypothetical protein